MPPVPVHCSLFQVLSEIELNVCGGYSAPALVEFYIRLDDQTVVNTAIGIFRKLPAL